VPPSSRLASGSPPSSRIKTKPLHPAPSSHPGDVSTAVSSARSLFVLSVSVAPSPAGCILRPLGLFSCHAQPLSFFIMRYPPLDERYVTRHLAVLGPSSLSHAISLHASYAHRLFSFLSCFLPCASSLQIILFMGFKYLWVSGYISPTCDGTKKIKKNVGGEKHTTLDSYGATTSHLTVVNSIT